MEPALLASASPLSSSSMTQFKHFHMRSLQLLRAERGTHPTVTTALTQATNWQPQHLSPHVSAQPAWVRNPAPLSLSTSNRPWCTLYGGCLMGVSRNTC